MVSWSPGTALDIQFSVAIRLRECLGRCALSQLKSGLGCRKGVQYRRIHHSLYIHPPRRCNQKRSRRNFASQCKAESRQNICGVVIFALHIRDQGCGQIASQEGLVRRLRWKVRLPWQNSQCASGKLFARACIYSMVVKIPLRHLKGRKQRLMITGGKNELSQLMRVD
jgi:hypothetical protein